jgi:hypothetical protein
VFFFSRKIHYWLSLIRGEQTNYKRFGVRDTPFLHGFTDRWYHTTPTVRMVSLHRDCNSHSLRKESSKLCSPLVHRPVAAPSMEVPSPGLCPCTYPHLCLILNCAIELFRRLCVLKVNSFTVVGGTSWFL